LVAKTIKSGGKRADYFFVTAGHAVEDCKGARRYLAENTNQPRYEADNFTVARQPQRLAPVAPVRIDDGYDLAVVKAEAAAEARIGAPVPVADTCERALGKEVYAVGFPGVKKRRKLA